MQPVGSTVPELEAGRRDAVATPVSRPWDVAVAEPFRRRSIARLQGVAAGDGTALRRRPGSDATAQRSGGEVGGRGSGIQPLHVAGDADLPFQRIPVEAQRSARVRRERHALVALVVRVEGQPALVESAQQHHADLRIAPRAHRRERDGGRLAQAGASSVAQPLLELAKGIGVQVQEPGAPCGGRHVKERSRGGPRAPQRR